MRAGVGMKRIVVHIDRLVLRGVRHEERHAVAAGLKGELSRWLAGAGAGDRLARLGHVPRLSLGRVSLAAGAGAEAVGVATARAVGRAADA